MIIDEIDKLLCDFERNEPARESLIVKAQEELSITLPEEYRVFLQKGNGGEGRLGENGYAILWKVEELADLNRDYEVAKYAPDLLLFGSDGGGEAFAFDLRSADMPIVALPFVGMDRSVMRPLGKTFIDFVQTLSSV